MAHIVNDGGFSSPSQNDHRAWLWVTTILSIVYSALFLVARLFGKYGMLWWDDAVLAAGYLLGIARWAIIMVAISQGLGADLGSIGVTSAATKTIASLAFSSRVLLLICHWLAKIAVLVFTRKVFSGDLNHEKTIFSVAFVTLLVTGVAAVLTGFAGCDPPRLLFGLPDAACSASTARWVVVCILDFISELVIIVAPVLLLRPVAMGKAKKRQVFMLFSFRIGSIGFFIAQTDTYIKFLHGGRTSIGLVPTLVLSEFLLCYSFMSSTIPCMRSFVGAFSSPMLKLGDTTMNNSSNGGHGNNSYKMRAMGSGAHKDSDTKRQNSQRQGTQRSDVRLRPDVADYDVGIEHRQRRRPGGEQDSLESDGSEQMIIRRDTHIHVSHGQPTVVRDVQ